MSPSPSGERDLRRLLAGMTPALDPTIYAFCAAPAGGIPAGVRPLARIGESEGETLILAETAAQAAGLAPVFLARRITLTIHSDLAAVGFLAAISSRLAQLGIPCNPVAGIYHDHLFVPPERAEDAMRALTVLQGESGNPDAAPVLYTVRLSLEASAADDWRQWMEAVHLPDVLATGCFETGTMAEELEPPPPAGRRVFVMQYRATSLERLQEYQAQHAPSLQQLHGVRYAGRFEASRSIRRLLLSRG